MNKNSVIALAAVLAASVAGSAQAEEFRITVAAGHPPVSLGVAGVQKFFIPEINRRLAEMGGEHSIEWTEAYGGSLADFNGVLEAVEDGIADMGYVVHLFEGDKLPLEQVSYVTPFGTNDTALMMNVISKLHKAIPEMGAAWEKHNQMVLAPTGIDTYHLLSNFPVNELGDLDGRRISVSGLATKWLSGTDAVPVSGALPTYYNSIATGLTDGMLTFESAVASYKFYEVAPIVTKVSFGAQYSSGLTINLDTWNRFPEDVKSVFLEVADAYRDRTAQAYTSAGEKSLQAARDAGAEIAEENPDLRKQLAANLPNIAREWAAALDAEGLPGTETLETYLRLSREAGVEFARDWSAQ